MVDIKRILCPIDFSDFSRRALDHAVALARWYKADVHVLHVLPLRSVAAAVGAYGGPLVLDPVLAQPPDLEHLRGDVLRFAEQESAPGVRLEALAAEGDVVEEILRAAADRRTDFIVMGTHGRSGFQRLLLGSVAEKVLLRKVSSPVLTVPPHVPDAAPAGPVLFRSILCPVDFSDASERALRYAFSLAGEGGARLNLVHVMEFPREDDALEFAFADYNRVRQEYRERALEQMHDLVPDDVRAFCTIHEDVPAGKPYREILRLADVHRSDLIVMGVAGRGAADIMLFGSTTNHVVRQAVCPVLTVRQ
jgi:nucleotide-binding universal stress UspA family protein